MRQAALIAVSVAVVALGINLVFWLDGLEATLR